MKEQKYIVEVVAHDIEVNIIATSVAKTSFRYLETERNGGLGYIYHISISISIYIYILGVGNPLQFGSYNLFILFGSESDLNITTDSWFMYILPL